MNDVQHWKTAVFIGRFQPFHKGHKAIVDDALKVADEVIVVVGSSFGPPTIRNPFTFETRKRMIKAVFPQDNVKVVPVMDYPYNDTKWIKAVKMAVASNRMFTADPETTLLVGYSKDETSYYLNMFPSWDSFDPGSPFTIDGEMLNSTDLREQMFTNEDVWGLVDLGCDHLTASIIAETLLNKSNNCPNEVYQTLLDEYDYALNYKADFGVNHFGKRPIHQTVDAVVTQADKVLLIRRKNLPGTGLWAIPGGFLEPTETLFDGAIRELREETVLKLPEIVLRKSLKATHTFDAVNRSSRGRVISNGFHFELNPEKPLPKVKGADDAWKAEWVDIEKIDSRKMFEDHAGILDFFLNIY